MTHGVSRQSPHPSTIPARQNLTSVVERERVYSLTYGRRQMHRKIRLVGRGHSGQNGLKMDQNCKIKILGAKHPIFPVVGGSLNDKYSHLFIIKIDICGQEPA